MFGNSGNSFKIYSSSGDTYKNTGQNFFARVVYPKYSIIAGYKHEIPIGSRLGNSIATAFNNEIKNYKESYPQPKTPQPDDSDLRIKYQTELKTQIIANDIAKFIFERKDARKYSFLSDGFSLKKNLRMLVGMQGLPIVDNLYNSAYHMIMDQGNMTPKYRGNEEEYKAEFERIFAENRDLDIDSLEQKYEEQMQWVKNHLENGNGCSVESDIINRENYDNINEIDNEKLERWKDDYANSYSLFEDLRGDYRKLDIKKALVNCNIIQGHEKTDVSNLIDVGHLKRRNYIMMISAFEGAPINDMTFLNIGVLKQLFISRIAEVAVAQTANSTNNNNCINIGVLNIPEQPVQQAEAVFIKEASAPEEITIELSDSSFAYPVESTNIKIKPSTNNTLQTHKIASALPVEEKTSSAPPEEVIVPSAPPMPDLPEAPSHKIEPKVEESKPLEQTDKTLARS